MAYIRKRGQTWYYTLETTDENGKRKRLVRAGGKTRAECERAYRLAMNEKDRTGRLHDARKISLADFLDQWKEEVVEKNFRANTIRTYNGAIQNHIEKDLGSKMIVDLTPRLLQKYINDTAEKYSRGTVSVILAVLKRSLGYAASMCGYLMINPAQPVQLPKRQTPKKKTHVFSPVELKKIFRRFPPDHQCGLPVHIAYHTGMRLGECLALSWDDIDMKDRMIHVHTTLVGSDVQAIPKTSASVREIPFGTKLHSILKKAHARQAENRLRYGSEYSQTKNRSVCIWPDGRQVDADAMRYFGKYCRETFGTGSFHSLRHTHATMLLEAGEDLELVSKRLGHANMNTTSAIYSHVLDKRIKKTVALLDQIL